MTQRAYPRRMITSRHWLVPEAQAREAEIRGLLDGLDLDALEAFVDARIDWNRRIYDDCVNLNPAGNVMNPRAEAVLAQGLSSHPSLGHAGAKYETGLEAVEEIEVLAADLACRVFSARHAEIRVGSGALANLYSFMATCRPGDAIIAPPASIGGHVTHHAAGAAGLYGLHVVEAPIDHDGFTIDVERLRELAHEVRPALITIGGSFNPFPHPVGAVKAIAADVGAPLLFDAAHVCGLIAGGAWSNPLDEGADLMTMSTYKSLGGPAGGLVLTNRDDLAERIDAIAYPGLTANFDVSVIAALAIALLDWIGCGREYATAMVDTSVALADALRGHGHDVTPTRSHQFAVVAARWGDGDAASRRLRLANVLTSGIGLPGRAGAAGIRMGTPEVVRRGMTVADMAELGDLVHRALTDDPEGVRADVEAFRHRFSDLHYVR
jgi:glycine hydroxymethyltransferase